MIVLEGMKQKQQRREAKFTVNLIKIKGAFGSIML